MRRLANVDASILKAFVTRAATTLALIAIILFFGGPFVWIVAQTFDAGVTGTLPWPGDPTLANIRALLDQPLVRTALQNSIAVSVASMSLATFLASLAGYGLSRAQFRRKQEVMYGVILLYAMPLTVTMVAIFELSIRLELNNNLRGLIIAETAIALTFLTWLMKGFYDAVPRQLDEAAMVDGASLARRWIGVVTPAALPGVGIVAGLAFVVAWSDALLPIVLISDPELTTLARFFFNSSASASSQREMATLGMLFLAPVLVVMLLLRRIVTSTLTRSIEER